MFAFNAMANEQTSVDDATTAPNATDNSAGAMQAPNPFDFNSWFGGSGAVQAAPTAQMNPLDPNFWGSFVNPKTHEGMHMIYMNPAQYTQFMTPEFYAQFMNPMTYMAMMNPQSYASFMDPNTWMYWMQPDTYTHMMDMSMYAQMMNPAAYMSFMNPALYAQWMNPAAYTGFMDAEQFAQWMNPAAIASTGVATEGGQTQ
jgi:hypothetical protein